MPAADPPDFIRVLADQVFSRSAGASLVTGNRLRVLCDATENYPAWEAAIEAAERQVCLEMYIIDNDHTGRRFVELLTRKAREGVEVRVLYDWFGSAHAAYGGLFRPLLEVGAEVRACNPPRLMTALGVLSRNHRKLLVVDTEVAFVSGLCIGDPWLGDPARGREPWRDTGVEIRGPAVADALWSFAESWEEAGGEVPESLLPARESIPGRGDVALRVIGTTPTTANLYRLDLLVAALARRSLWLTDAYFMATPVYLGALQNAARDGVDVRLLVPRSSDVPLISTLSRTQYRPLLEAGIRVFEWDGPMIHAKTAVADGRWARVGSTNLNLSSWFGNWELDVAIEDAGVAGELEARFLEDLRRSTEVVLSPRHRVVLSSPRERLKAVRERARSSARGAVRYAARLGGAVNAAVRGRRLLDAAEAGALATIGAGLVAVALLAWHYPAVIVAPIALVLAWVGITAVLRAVGLYWKRRQETFRGGVDGAASRRPGNP
ncbi:phospholipase D-like domain-containing protein [Pelomicrobium methylotrophicum]|uniref:Phosphatidylserine/phosphatidylglycerophosphate/ cardiolipin synthase family protein n=1 Tax=Pelomicrobium methylotrophicum TaxID=2602750 RepID=A0A5C7EU65_9PROT|nr:phosphatidylserine/phosphatidylglycerophosphate/cardiolipin synthase family protein [Pelomicrobium methylotrophicum]TXF10607.1 phosphatidylserine/phosphatidylglycerophosphate/cardiolipin synthase family protein [Pelomicrobium methylotrophicum]